MTFPIASCKTMTAQACTISMYMDPVPSCQLTNSRGPNPRRTTDVSLYLPYWTPVMHFIPKIKRLCNKGKNTITGLSWTRLKSIYQNCWSIVSKITDICSEISHKSTRLTVYTESVRRYLFQERSHMQVKRGCSSTSEKWQETRIHLPY